jgi:flotillin
METLISSLPFAIPGVIVLGIFLWILKLRRIVPTNVVHIVQRGQKTVSYGVNKTSNVYYEWPSWLPKLGVEVRVLPVSNFDIDLENYSAYDKDRVPFVVDVKAFFHIADTNIAAAKVSSYDELRAQLKNVVQGAVRSILAKSPLESIMEERSIFGEQFTEAVNKDLKNWGVESIKNIELMDVRDAQGSEVIHQIMAKRMSAIDMESRLEVAKNTQLAEEAELEARQKVSVKKADTDKIAGEAQARSAQAIGIANAEAKKKAGIADQQALAEVAEAQKETEEKNMEVKRVTDVRTAEINKQSAIIRAEENKATEIINVEKEKKKVEVATDAEKYRVQTTADAKKYQIEVNAQAELESKQREAEGKQAVGEAEARVIESKGLAEALALEKEQLASVTAQTTLAQEIGDNEGYQKYLIDIKKIEISENVDIETAKAHAEALKSADLKILANSGDVQTGLTKFTDILSSKGGSQLNGLMESLKQTPEGQGLLSLLSNLGSNSTDTTEG